MTIDQRLVNSSDFIIDLDLCQVRLSKNAAFPWVILIPKLDNAVEILDLSSAQQHQLMDEITHVSILMRDIFEPDKLNIATLGNIVPQLHIHIIARYKTDATWPNPVWNTITTDYPPDELADRIKSIQSASERAGLRP